MQLELSNLPPITILKTNSLQKLARVSKIAGRASVVESCIIYATGEVSAFCHSCLVHWYVLKSTSARNLELQAYSL